LFRNTSLWLAAQSGGVHTSERQCIRYAAKRIAELKQIEEGAQKVVQLLPLLLKWMLMT
jgi:hypothetical protein